MGEQKWNKATSGNQRAQDLFTLSGRKQLHRPNLSSKGQESNFTKVIFDHECSKPTNWVISKCVIGHAHLLTCTFILITTKYKTINTSLQISVLPGPQSLHMLHFETLFCRFSGTSLWHCWRPLWVKILWSSYSQFECMCQNVWWLDKWLMSYGWYLTIVIKTLSE